MPVAQYCAACCLAAEDLLAYCQHGYYVGEDPTICGELEADTAWNEANPPLVAHLLGLEHEPEPGQLDPQPERAVSRLLDPIILSRDIPDIHRADGGRVKLTQPGSRVYRCLVCAQGFRAISVQE
jgi:hypothetical protein